MDGADVVQHYGRSGIFDAIRGALSEAGVDLERLGPEALSGVDEFHLGGRLATVALIESLELTTQTSVLDVGSGIGGAARAIASYAGCEVTGIDLTPEFVDTAACLSELVGLGERTTFRVGSATELPFGDATFDIVTILHVGMNIADKHGLVAELGRVLRPGGTLAVYDIMRVGDGDVTYPVPWASEESSSFVAPVDDYLAAMAANRLAASEPVDRLPLVRAVLAQMQSDPPPVNLSHLMGADWPTMFGNLGAAMTNGVVAPTQINARRLP